MPRTLTTTPCQPRLPGAADLEGGLGQGAAHGQEPARGHGYDQETAVHVGGHSGEAVPLGVDQPESLVRSVSDGETQSNSLAQRQTALEAAAEKSRVEATHLVPGEDSHQTVFGISHATGHHLGLAVQQSHRPARLQVAGQGHLLERQLGCAAVQPEPGCLGQADTVKGHAGAV